MMKKNKNSFENIKIGPFSWTLKEKDKKSMKNLGECDFENLTICILKGLNKDIKISTIFHEIFHAAFASSGYFPKNEEAVVDVLASQLLFFLRNNPEFIEYLKEHL